ncbi:MAG TPA: alpha/beta hydrolase [Pseudolabrys sp.]|nr:alpha/beta hydrolase [Pseudolabrys sp.]
MNFLEYLLIALAVLYCGMLALMFAFQRRLMYFPGPRCAPPEASGLLEAHEVELASADGERLVAWYVAARGEKPIVIYFQGNAGGLDLRAERFRKLISGGNGLLALCYRGYGGSSGYPSEKGLLLDARAAYDFAAARAAPKRIVLFGESLGTGVAVALAAERTVGALILDAPFTSAAGIGASAYPYVPVRWLIRDAFRSDERIAKVNAPLLVLHGEQDRIVPIRFGEKLLALAREPKRMVRFPDGGHVDLDQYGAMDEVGKFLAEHCRPDSPR